MHVAYPVRPGDDNTELRYALRSLENMGEIDEVWIVGDKPSWLTGVRFIEGNLWGTKPRNVYNNILTLCQEADVPDEFVMMNDDFFIMEPHAVVPEYRCSLAEHLATLNRLQRGSWWERSLLHTQEFLAAAGCESPLSYELHRPFAVNKARMAETLERAAGFRPDNPPQWRTLYGNLWHIGGEQRDDNKVYAMNPTYTARDWGVISSEPRSYFRAAPFVERRFTTPSRWESD